MRYLIAGAALLLAGTVAAILVAPKLVDEEWLERRLGAAVLAITGQPLDVAGDIDIKLLPQPLLTVYRPSVGSAASGFMLTADRLDLDLDLLSLLVGASGVNEATLVRPSLQIEKEAAAVLSAWADRLAASGTVPPMRRLRIVGGVLSLPEREPMLEAIDAVLDREGDSGSSRLDLAGRFAAASGDATLDLEAQFGAAPRGRPVPTALQLEVAQDATVSRLAFRGLARLPATNQGIEGRLSLDLPSPRSLAALGPTDKEPVLLPTTPVSLDARLALDFADVPTLRLDEGALVVDGQPLSGSADLAFAAGPTLHFELAAEALTLPDTMPRMRELPAALAQALPAGLAGRATFETDVLEWRSLPFRQVAVEFALTGTGALDVTQASARLPGPGDLAFTGRLGPLGDNPSPKLTGRLDVTVQQPASLVAALLPPPEPVRRSTTLSLATELTWEPDALALRALDLRLDALHAEGGVAWRAGNDERLPQLAVRGRIDRLAVDDVVDVAAPMATAEALLDQLTALDLALDLRVERASLDATRLGGLVLQLDSRSGRLTIDRASLTDVAGSAATVAGGIDAADRAFDLTLAVDIASLPRLLRLVGEPPEPGLALLGPLNLRARLDGDLEEAAIAATLDADHFTATGEARLGPWQRAPSGRVTATLDGREAAALVRLLGAVPVSEPLLDGPLRATVVLDLEQGAAASAALETALGGLTLALDAERGPAALDHFDRFALRLGPLDRDRAAALYRAATPLLDLVPGPPSAWLGDWPAQALRWDWLWAQDAELSLRLLPADLLQPPIEMQAQWGDGRLTIPAFRYESDRGTIEASMAVTGRSDRRLADVAIDLAAESIAAEAVLEAIAARGDALTGHLSMEARLSTFGSSLRSLVANLGGQLDVVVTDGVLGATAAERSGLPIDRLVATLEAERGIVRPSGDGIAFTGPDGLGSIDGYADLLAWIVELNLASDALDGQPLIRQRVFGPIGDVSAAAADERRRSSETPGPAAPAVDLTTPDEAADHRLVGE